MAQLVERTWVRINSYPIFSTERPFLLLTLSKSKNIEKEAVNGTFEKDKDYQEAYYAKHLFTVNCIEKQQWHEVPTYYLLSVF